MKETRQESIFDRAKTVSALDAVERLLALSEEQTEPKRFYSYDTLRGMGISGKADIAPALGELKQHGVTVLFPNSPKREQPTDKYARRGIVLIKAIPDTKG